MPKQRVLRILNSLRFGIGFAPPTAAICREDRHDVWFARRNGNIGWLFSVGLAFWHVVSAGSLWVGAALAAAGLAPHVCGASLRILNGPEATVLEGPLTGQERRRADS